MAIVRMKKLRAVAPMDQRDHLLEKLMLLGCIQFKQQDEILDNPEVAFLVHSDCRDVTSIRTERSIFEEAIRILDRVAPQKSPLLSPKQEISAEKLLDASDESALKQKAKELSLLDEKLRNLDADETSLKLKRESLQPWKSCPMPLDTEGTKHVAVRFGMFAANTDMDAVNATVAVQTEDFELLELSADETAIYTAVFFLRSEEEKVLSALREFGFAIASFSSCSGNAAEELAKTERYLKELQEDREQTNARIAATVEYREGFRLCYDRLGTYLERAESSGLLLRTESAVLMEGWMPAEKEEAVSAVLDEFDCGYEILEPDESEYPEVPVKLRNNRLTDGLNMVTNMYSLPQYGTVDPNPLMAPFFILFYGIMMADIGYGVLMMLIGLLLLKKKRPKEGFIKYFAELMLEGGLATAVMGALSGGLFGDAPYQIVHLLNPDSTWAGLPALFNPLEDTIAVLIGAMILGFIHLNAGMVISFVMKKRKGNLADAIWEEGAMWVTFIGIASALLGFGNVGGVPVGLIVALCIYAFGKARSGKGIGRLISIFSGLYSDVTGWFGDILSYARLMALMLAGSVIAQVFNNLGAMPGSILIFIPIFLLGNTLNFGLNLLGCYVHDLRLQCLEFFNKFYVDGGKPFRPLAVRSKYYDVTNK